MTKTKATAAAQAQERQLIYQADSIRAGLTKQNFREWLNLHPSPQNITAMSDYSACPIALYMMQTFGLERVTVSSFRIQSPLVLYFSMKESQSSDVPPVPEWVREYLEKDKIKPSVTVSDALRILDQITVN